MCLIDWIIPSMVKYKTILGLHVRLYCLSWLALPALFRSIQARTYGLKTISSHEKWRFILLLWRDTFLTFHGCIGRCTVCSYEYREFKVYTWSPISWGLQWPIWWSHDGCAECLIHPQIWSMASILSNHVIHRMILPYRKKWQTFIPALSLFRNYSFWCVGWGE